MSDSLPILHADDWVVVVDKPAGLLVHRSSVDRSARRFALQMVRDQVGGRVYPVHRLDKPTSGVLLFGRTSAAAAALQEQFRLRAVTKRYLAVVRGWMEANGTIDYALRADPERRRDDPDNPGKAARTHFETLATVELPFAVGRYKTGRFSLLRLQPETGRRHQIRRHLKHIFHPIIGDRKYGDDRQSRFVAASFGCDRLLLFASEIGFTHPGTGDATIIAADPPADLSELCRQWGWEAALRASTSNPA